MSQSEILTCFLGEREREREWEWVRECLIPCSTELTEIHKIFSLFLLFFSLCLFFAFSPFLSLIFHSFFISPFFPFHFRFLLVLIIEFSLSFSCHSLSLTHFSWFRSFALLFLYFSLSFTLSHFCISIFFGEMFSPSQALLNASQKLSFLTFFRANISNTISLSPSFPSFLSTFFYPFSLMFLSLSFLSLSDIKSRFCDPLKELVCQ